MTITLTRGIDSETDTSLKSSQTIAVPLLYLDFPSLAKYYSGSNTNIVLSSGVVMPAGTYVGVGGISTIGTSEESTELKSTSLTAEINGLDSSAIALVLSEQYYGRDALFGIAVLNSSYQIIGEPILLFKGFISVLNTQLDTDTKITVNIESILADWERPRVKRYNDASQKLIDGTDTGFRNVENIINKEIIWG
jgi:hypothetical protein